MTKQEIIKMLQKEMDSIKYIAFDRGGEEEAYTNAFKVVIELLNQLDEQKECHVDTESNFLPSCSLCGAIMIAGDSESVKQNYCYECGARIKWGLRKFLAQTQN